MMLCELKQPCEDAPLKRLSVTSERVYLWNDSLQGFWSILQLYQFLVASFPSCFETCYCRQKNGN